MAGLAFGGYPGAALGWCSLIMARRRIGPHNMLNFEPPCIFGNVMQLGGIHHRLFSQGFECTSTTAGVHVSTASRCARCYCVRFSGIMFGRSFRPLLSMQQRYGQHLLSSALLGFGVVCMAGRAHSHRPSHCKETASRSEGMVYIDAEVVATRASLGQAVDFFENPKLLRNTCGLPAMGNQPEVKKSGAGYADLLDLQVMHRHPTESLESKVSRARRFNRGGSQVAPAEQWNGETVLVVVPALGERQLPLNPMYANGEVFFRAVYGRGDLGKWGPNYAADSIVTYTSPDGRHFVLLIERGDRQRRARLVPGAALMWERAFPGGMVDPDDEGIFDVVAKRELREETGLDWQAIAPYVSSGREVARGYVEDPRNTVNAWMVTVALHYHLHSWPAAADMPKVRGLDDARSAGWYQFFPEREFMVVDRDGNEMSWYPGHGRIFRRIGQPGTW